MPRSDVEAEFADFHRENPHVYEAMVRLARRALSQDPCRRRLSARMLWEVVRYETWSRLSRRSVWKLNNNLVPLYARLIMGTEPDLRGVFETHASSRGTASPSRSGVTDGSEGLRC
jgi:hypothetical protein